MTIEYRNENITKAKCCLAVEDRLLSAKIAEAHTKLIIAMSRRDGFEKEFQLIEDCFRNVKDGDYSGLTQDQLVTIKTNVMQIYGSLPEVRVWPEAFVLTM
jgi:hypothetical protein